jgi:chromosome partitioning protein
VERIVIAAHKGGAGKTTVTVNLAAALAARGQRVLVVDCDPQSAAAASLGVSPSKPTLYEAVMGKATVREAIVTTRTEGLVLLPSDLDLAGAEVELPRESHWQEALAKCLAPIQTICDVGLIDTPPGLGVLSYTALRAATAAIVVCPLEFLAYRSITHLLETTQRAGVPLLGIVPTFSSDGTRHAKEVSDALVEDYRELVLPGIPRRVALRDAALAGRPINAYQPSSDSAAAFAALGQEVLSRAASKAA